METYDDPLSVRTLLRHKDRLCRKPLCVRKVKYVVNLFALCRKHAEEEFIEMLHEYMKDAS